jgi:NAD(P)-dependent dehydrogenase (short-subunit alcohol dehydrogenase family)
VTETGAVDLSRSTALVTGGADGIGAATVRALRATGCRVAIADVDDERGRALAAETGGLFVSCDVRSSASVDAAVALAESTFGSLNLVHLNAGVTTGSPSVDVSDDDYRRLVSVNLDGVFFGLRAALPALRRSGGGVAVATASVGGLAPIPVDPLYGMTKHGVVGLVRSAAPGLAADNIRLVGLCPGFTDTRLVADQIDAVRALGFPLMTAETIAAAVVRAVQEAEPGECWFVQAGREAQPYGFRGIPGPVDA